jgi:V/A-type H+-transporting ATPase subunit I
MAVIDMCKMSLIAHSADRHKILRELVKLGVVETVRSEQIERAHYYKDAEGEAKYNSLINKLNFVFTFFKERSSYAAKRNIEIPVKLNLAKINRLFDVEEFESAGKNEYELLQKVAEIEELNARLTENNSKAARLLARREQLLAYKELDIKFSDIRDSKNVCIRVGTLSLQGAERLSEGAFPGAVITGALNAKSVLAAVIFHKTEEHAAVFALAQADFMPCPFNEDIIASEEIERIERQLTECEKTAEEITRAAVALFPLAESLKVLYDYYLVSLKKIEVIANASATGSAFLLEGWVPEPDKTRVQEALSRVTKNIYIDFRPPAQDETPPVYVKSPKAVEPFQSITNMYGLPNPKEGDSDPNIFVAIFYFLFFGIMMGDAGYGIIIALACFLFYYFKRPKKGSGKMILVFGLCGVSTFIWGALFAGWFGLSTQVLQASSVGRFLLKFSWFSPLEEPLMMFGLALALGAVQIAVGFAINAYNKWKKSKADAILNNISWVVILLGIGALALGALWGGIISTIGGALAGVGAVMLVIGGTLGRKGLLKKVTGSFSNVYGGINVFSDILSYSRLFGLGLTTGVIGMVVNFLADIIIQLLGANVLGYIAAVIVVIGGHTFNLGINLLGTYVHNSRLQYIEFFSKFYQGTGRPFKPLGSETKYIFLDN